MTHTIPVQQRQAAMSVQFSRGESGDGNRDIKQKNMNHQISICLHPVSYMSCHVMQRLLSELMSYHVMSSRSVSAEGKTSRVICISFDLTSFLTYLYERCD